MENPTENTIEKPFKKPYYKRWYVWLIAAIIVFAAINNLTSKPAATSAPVPTAQPWESSAVTVESVKSAIDGQHWNRSLTGSDIVKVTVTDGSIGVYVRLKQDYGAQDELMQVGNTLVVVAEILFKNPAVKSVGVWGDAAYSDQYGKDVTAPAAKIIWERATSDKIDYKNYRDMTLVDFKRPFTIASKYEINPATYKALSADDKVGLPAQR